MSLLSGTWNSVGSKLWFMGWYCIAAVGCTAEGLRCLATDPKAWVWGCSGFSSAVNSYLLIQTWETKETKHDVDHITSLCAVACRKWCILTIVGSLLPTACLYSVSNVFWGGWDWTCVSHSRPLICLSGVFFLPTDLLYLCQVEKASVATRQLTEGAYGHSCTFCQLLWFLQQLVCS